MKHLVSAPAPVLGSGYDPSGPETAQELCVAQRNILLAALRYDTVQHQAHHNSLVLAWQVKLLALDEDIVAQLAGTPAGEAYLAADYKAQTNLLFSNNYLTGQGGLGLGQVLLAQAGAVAGHDLARALFAQKQGVLEKLNAVVAPEPADTAGPPAIARDLRPWLRYYAWRKVHYLNQLEREWLLHHFVADETRLLTQLHQGSDLALAQPAQFARKLSLKARPPAPAAGPEPVRPLLAGGGSASDDFASAKSELADVTSQLKKAAADLSNTGLKDTVRLKEYEEQYAALSQKQAAYTYLLAQKRNSLTTTTWAVEKTKDWLAANRADTTAVVMATGKALWAGAGLSLAQALKDHYNGQPVDPELGKKVLTGVAIAAGTALATYLLGPVGPMVSGMALGYFYPQPDPVMDRLKSIEGKVDLGFSRTERQLTQLAVQVKQGFSDVEKKLDNMVQALGDTSDLRQELHRFKEAVEQAEELLTQLELPYNRLFEAQTTERTAPTDELVKQLAAFGAKLDALVRRFYRRDYQLDLGRLDGTGTPGRLPLAPSLSQLIIAFYQRPDPACFQPFHVACADLSALADRLRLLVVRYFEVRPKVQAVLAAAAVFMVEEHKGLLLRHLLDMQRREADEQGAYFAGVMQLGRLVLGARNHTLYLNLTPYLLADDPRAAFTLLTGFGLLPAANPDQHYEPGQGTSDAPATWLRAAPRPAAPARYYLAPVGRSKTDLTYQLYSFWHHATLPARLRLHLALARHDQVLLSPVGFGGEAVLAQAVGCESPAFADSFEQWVLTGSPVTPTDLFLLPARTSWRKSLPQAGIELGLKDGRHHRNAGPPEVSLMGAQWASALFKDGTHALNERDSLWPLLRPDVVGVCQKKEEELAYDQGWYARIGAGLWTTQQALGAYKPVVADETKQRYQRPFAEEWSGRLPFRHVLYPGDHLQSLRSPDGRYWLQLDCWPGPAPVLYRYENGQRQGSVFNKYDYRDQIGQLRIQLQADGNLVLYDDDAAHVVAATHTGDLPNSLLRLDNQGQLELCAPDGALRRTLALHTLKMKRGECTSYWQTPGVIDQDRQLRSPNGQHVMKLEFCGGGVEHVSMVLELWRVGLQLGHYKRQSNGEETKVGSWDRPWLLLPPVSHTDDGDMAHFAWEKCSDDLVQYIDKHVSESKQMKVRLDFRAGGEVVGQIVSRQLILIKNYYGFKAAQLLASNDESRAGVFLALDDEGHLHLRGYHTDKLLYTFF